MKRVKLNSARAIGQPSFQLLSVSTQHVGRESHVITVGVAGTRRAHNGTDCPTLRHSIFHQFALTTSYAMYTELLSSREVHCTTTEPNGSRCSSVTVVTTCRPGHDRRMQVRFLAEGQRFSCSVRRADRAGGPTESPTRLRLKVYAPGVK
jgi:hypothetical protein